MACGLVRIDFSCDFSSDKERDSHLGTSTPHTFGFAVQLYYSLRFIMDHRTAGRQWHAQKQLLEYKQRKALTLDEDEDPPRKYSRKQTDVSNVICPYETLSFLYYDTRMLKLRSDYKRMGIFTGINKTARSTIKRFNSRTLQIIFCKSGSFHHTPDGFYLDTALIRKRRNRVGTNTGLFQLPGEIGK